MSDPQGVVEPYRVRFPLYAAEPVSVDIEGDDRTIDVSFLGGNERCWLVGFVHVAFARERIELGIYGGYHRPPPGADCTLDAAKYRLSLRLDQPVSGRPIEFVERLSEPY